MKNRNIMFVTIFLALGLLAFSRVAQAVVPPPDGGYPGFNTAEGQNALKNLTTGAANTAVGWFSLFGTSSGSFNTAVGAGALDLNTADNNTAVGVAALLLNTTGTDNTANGRAALEFNDTGLNNTAVGSTALFSNTTGNLNTANGVAALVNNTTGNGNTAIGVEALAENTAGNNNTAIGAGALLNSTGSGNVALGVNAGVGVAGASNVIAIGAGVIGADVADSCFIGHIRGVQTANADAIPVLIDSAGQLGTASSSARFKKEIKPMEKASEAILALKPVTFHYKSDTKGTPQFGLIAEEVAEVNPDLVVRDEKGQIYTVRYDQVNAMLLNEFLKEHQTVQQQGATIVRLEKQIEALTAGLQKVSAQVEASKPAPQVVNNP
jgi:hypothetical protein